MTGLAAGVDCKRLAVRGVLVYDYAVIHEFVWPWRHQVSLVDESSAKLAASENLTWFSTSKMNTNSLTL